MLTLKQIDEKFLNAGVNFSQVALRNNIITVRQGFFYANGGTSDKQIEKVKRSFKNVTILDSGKIWKPFKGGASIANQSHWFVKFTTTDIEDKTEITTASTLKQ